MKTADMHIYLGFCEISYLLVDFSVFIYLLLSCMILQTSCFQICCSETDDKSHQINGRVVFEMISDQINLLIMKEART